MGTLEIFHSFNSLVPNQEGRGVLRWIGVIALVLSLHHHRQHGYPSWWVRQAACIRYHESRGIWTINTGNGYYGAYQFRLSTWAAHVVPGWTLRPDRATPAQQTFVAWRTWLANGRSWYGQWGTAGMCV